MKIKLTEEEVSKIMDGLENHLDELLKESNFDVYAYRCGYIKTILKQVLSGHISEEELKYTYIKN